MIPVTPQIEPVDFDTKVRIPGRAFLSSFSGHPSNNDFRRNGAQYWRKALDQLYLKYSKTCAYSAEWIPKKQKSIDHFIPKVKDKNLAFEWDNYRLCTKQINQNKDSNFVIDPFKIKFGWFVIDFDLNLIKPQNGLHPILRQEIINTLKILDLNNIIYKNKRTAWIDAYYRGTTDFSGLRQKVPFIWYELKRQKLEEEIKKKHERFLMATRRL